MDELTDAEVATRLKLAKGELAAGRPLESATISGRLLRSGRLEASGVFYLATAEEGLLGVPVPSLWPLDVFRPEVRWALKYTSWLNAQPENSPFPTAVPAGADVQAYYRERFLRTIKYETMSELNRAIDGLIEADDWDYLHLASLSISVWIRAAQSAVEEIIDRLYVAFPRNATLPGQLASVYAEYARDGDGGGEIADRRLAAWREEFPASSMLRFWIAERELRRGNVEQAEKLYLETLEVCPHHVWSLNSLRIIDRRRYRDPLRWPWNILALTESWAPVLAQIEEAPKRKPARAST